jgi:hypothetical protein
MLFLSLAGLATLRYTRGIPGALGAALLLALAFFTKQHAAWFVLAATAHLALSDRRRLIPFVAAAAVGCAGGYLALTAWLGPWFPFFTLEIPSHWSQVNRMRILRYAGTGLIGTLGMLVGPAVVSLALAGRPWQGPAGLWAWGALAAVGTGLMATLDPSAYHHVYMPTMMMFSLVGPIALQRLAAAAESTAVASRQAAYGAAFLVLSFQFVPLVYTFHDQLPHPRAVEAYRALVEDIRGKPGKVLAPYHGFYTWVAGKGTSLHIIPLDDILRATGNRLLARDPQFQERLFEPLRSGPDRPVIIADVPLRQSGRLWAAIEDSYALAGDLGWISTPLRPVTGNRFTPTFVYVPREPAPPPSSANPPEPDASGRAESATARIPSSPQP